jgi:hypothetical protein
VQEPFENFGGVQGLKDAVLLLRGDRLAHAFESFLEPLLLDGVHDVHVLNAHCAAVGVAKNGQNLLEGGFVTPGQRINEEGSLQVPNCQPVGRQIQLRVQRRSGVRERVEVGTEGDRGRGTY